MSKYRLDEVDHQILDMLIDNTRVPFTDIAKKLLISAGTVHVSVLVKSLLLLLLISQPVNLIFSAKLEQKILNMPKRLSL